LGTVGIPTYAPTDKVKGVEVKMVEVKGVWAKGLEVKGVGGSKCKD
jgi:hypothetical protein